LENPSRLTRRIGPNSERLDEFCPRTQQDVLLDSILNARLLTYAGTGHGLHWEEPARFAVDLTTFVQGVAGGGPTAQG
jgi:non-heme chloroperoxidase